MPVKLFANHLGDRFEIPIEMIRFSAGDLQPRIGRIPVSPDIRTLQLRVDFRSSDDLVAMLLVTDAARRHPVLNHVPISALIPYFPGARQDRVCFPGEPLTARVVTDLVNSLNFETVTIWDPHSDVVPAALDRCRIRAAAFWGTRRMKHHTVIVAPDKGAVARAEEFAHAHNAAAVWHAMKARDPVDGRIVGIKLEGDVSEFNGNDFLMVDDISDGGRTFIELAKILRQHTTGKINLFVTHLVGAGGFEKFRGVIDHIYTPNCFVADPPADLVTVLD